MSTITSVRPGSLLICLDRLRCCVRAPSPSKGKSLTADESPKSTSRRDFLSGLAAGESETPKFQPNEGAYLTQLSRQAMASTFEIYLNSQSSGKHTDDAIAALDLVTALEEQLSAYRYDSEICRLNATAYLRPMVVEQRLWELLQLCVELFEATTGAFDVTSGPLSKVWGFFDRQGKVPQEEDLARAIALVGSDQMTLDPNAQTLHFTQEGIELNLGSIGKGYALDRCRELLEQAEVADFLIHGGSSSVLARGNRQVDSDEPGWEVGIPHPVRNDQRIGTVRLKDEALGTSGAAFQAFYHQGKRYGHVLDPRTGRPRTGILGATAVASSATLADALATACYVMNDQEIEKLLEYYPHVSVLRVLPGAKRGSIETVTYGDMADRIQLA